MMKEIQITTDYIKLDQFLKLSGVAGTGGHAKILISEGQIKVNDVIALERGKKIRKNDIVEIIDFEKFKIV